jgi:hypothetical protein
MGAAMVLTYVSIASGLLPVIAAAINFRHLNTTLKLAAAFFIISALFDIMEWLVLIRYLTNAYRTSAPFLHLFILLSLIFYGAIYYRSFNSRALKTTTLIMETAALAIIIFYTIKNSIWNYPSFSNTVLSIFLIPISLLYFYQLLNPKEFVHIEKQPMFWINSGVLIYFSINVFLFMLFELIDNKSNYYMIHSVTNTVTNLLFAIGLFCKPQKTTSLLS